MKIRVYIPPKKQTELYTSIISDDNVSEDLNAILIDTLGYVIEPEHLFNNLTEKTKQNIF